MLVAAVACVFVVSIGPKTDVSMPKDMDVVANLVQNNKLFENPQFGQHYYQEALEMEKAMGAARDPEKPQKP